MAAQSPDNKDIIRVASRQMENSFPGGLREIESIEVLGEAPDTDLYIIQLRQGGWIIIAGDKRVIPVIGFGFDGRFADDGILANESASMWIEAYAEQIQEIRNEKGGSVHKGWTEDSGYKTFTKEDLTSIEPLIEAEWSQGKGWNEYCPPDLDGPDGKALVGCVAVAMGQALYAFQAPDSGYSSHTYYQYAYGNLTGDYSSARYHWDSMLIDMPNKHSALILYHCATSVEMEFGPSSSSAQTADIVDAFKEYFYMSENMVYKVRQDYGDVFWKNMIIDELQNGRTVIYKGRSPDGDSGHAFNIDGLSDGEYFHINWGWGGNSNGYFLIDELNPTSTRSYNNNQAAIIGVQPYNYPTALELSDTIVLFEQPEGSAVGALLVSDESTSNEYTISLICDSTLIDSEWIYDYYIDGDTLRTGRTFTLNEKLTDTISLNLIDLYNNELNTEIVLSLKEKTEASSIINERMGNVLIYPNPVKDILRFRNSSGIGLTGLRVFSMGGELVRRIEGSAVTEGLSVESMTPGIYIIEIEFADKVIIRSKFVRN